MAKLKDLVTEADGESIDAVRVLFILGVLVFLLLALINFAHFAAQEFGLGFGGLLGGGGAATGARAWGERNALQQLNQ